ncbi:Uncharacterised protein [Mycoplasmopsis synoviae]|uniref:Uncharacterized protein n=1 Tax=Mycoplasmopsis synoviae TaxID=2109 RepID=A0A3B0P5T6_MYCSY|nr:Uncharacterised protein [Mycoplasmopsis synoviae]
MTQNCPNPLVAYDKTPCDIHGIEIKPIIIKVVSKLDSETYFVLNNSKKKNTPAIGHSNTLIEISKPTVAATPFPPLNLKYIG